MLHQKVSLSTQRQGGDAWIRAKEALVIAVVGYGVRTCGIVVHKAEVVGRIREDLSDFSKIIETLRNRARATVFVTIRRYGFGGLVVDEETFRCEAGCVVYAEDCRAKK